MLAETQLLATWEAGVSAPPLARALALGRWSAPGAAVERLPIGERDELILELRSRLYGDALPVESACPACREPVEATVSIHELRGMRGDAAAKTVTWGGETFPVRAPSSEDLRVAEDEGSLAAACVPGAPSAALGDAEFLAAVADRVAAVDPLAEIQVELECGCGHRWGELLDPAQYVWSEVERSARNLLSVVGSLARAYGWSEAEILGMSPRRRALYLELAQP